MDVLSLFLCYLTEFDIIYIIGNYRRLNSRRISVSTTHP